jgi:hypothetical protein
MSLPPHQPHPHSPSSPAYTITVTAIVTVTTGPVCSDSEDSISIDIGATYGSNWDEYCGPAVGFAKYSAVKLRDHW